MRSVQTSAAFPLSSVKPLEGLVSYRAHCLAQTRKAFQGGGQRRERSPVGGARVELWGKVDGFEYGRCPESGSLFLAELPSATRWATLLADINRFRRSPDAFHPSLAQSRADNVYLPKLEWVRATLRLHGIEQPRVLDVTTPPSEMTGLLQDSGMCAEVVAVDEMGLITTPTALGADGVHAALLFESLDRVDDPFALVRNVSDRLVEGGLVFLTALVASGFDFAVLGLHNMYLYPPDRTNCFSLRGLSRLLERAGLTLVEVSTPGVLDVEIVRAHAQLDPSLPLAPFERQLIEADEDTQRAFQTFLQQQGLSSFARIVAKKP